MKFALRYTAIRARDLDRSVGFYTNVLGLSLRHRIKVPETKGEFAIIEGEGSEHWLEVNWYAEDSPVASSYHEGDELDHLAFEVEDLDQTLRYLEGEGYPMVSHRRRSERSEWAYVKNPDGIWIELFQRHDRRRSGVGRSPEGTDEPWIPQATSPTG